jgi:hypothetical protein
VVVTADTVVDPRAMVVKSAYTPVALVAVSAPWRPENLAVWANSSSVIINE